MRIKNETRQVLIKLTNERVWRTYLGGQKLDELHGLCKRGDGHFPEEWIASLVSARNVGRDHIKDEGLSKLKIDDCLTLKELIESEPEYYLGLNHVENYGAVMGVLVKLIDSCERLTVQVHPDRKQAELLFQSKYGKTECWHILGGRESEGQHPYVYLGFKEGVTKERWKQLFDEQDIDGMLSSMHRYEVKTGDTILIEGGVPHAIGAGCFLIEIQEPTDFTIRMERLTPSKFAVEDSMCHQGLGFGRMFDCFSYQGLSRAEMYARWFILPEFMESSESADVTSLISYKNTTYFKMNCLNVRKEWVVQRSQEFCVLYCLEGNGMLEADGEVTEINCGDQFFVPSGVKQVTLRAGHRAMNVLQCFGPECQS